MPSSTRASNGICRRQRSVVHRFGAIEPDRSINPRAGEAASKNTT